MTDLGNTVLTDAVTEFLTQPVFTGAAVNLNLRSSSNFFSIPVEPTFLPFRSG